MYSVDSNLSKLWLLSSIHTHTQIHSDNDNGTYERGGIKCSEQTSSVTLAGNKTMQTTLKPHCQQGDSQSGERLVS